MRTSSFQGKSEPSGAYSGGAYKKACNALPDMDKKMQDEYAREQTIRSICCHYFLC